MVDEAQQPPQSVVHKRRKTKPNKRPQIKRMKSGPGMGKKAKISKEMKNLYRKRARNYNSDDDEEDEDEREAENDGEDMEADKDDNSDISDNEAGPNKGEGSDEELEVRSGITRLSEGCNAFRSAFLSIIKKHTDDEALGPVLSAHKKLVVAKLAEEVTERKVKGEAKKEKQLVEEKGHVKPANFLDSHEKVLIGVATKGVVKLFNAVNKAQNAQKGLNPSSFKDAKALTKRRKEAFMKELSKASAPSADATTKGSAKDGEDNCQPAWAPLRDTYMLTNSKLKDWDKMAVEEEKDMDI